MIASPSTRTDAAPAAAVGLNSEPDGAEANVGPQPVPAQVLQDGISADDNARFRCALALPGGVTLTGRWQGQKLNFRAGGPLRANDAQRCAKRQVSVGRLAARSSI